MSSMAIAVENASIVIPMISSEYQHSENCEKELSYADSLKKNIVPVLLEPKFKPTGWLALVIARFKYVDISETGASACKIDEIVTIIENFISNKSRIKAMKKMVAIFFFSGIGTHLLK